jgi:hypothetical protein
MSFKQNLQTGRIAEGLIARWLMSRGASVMPAYEIEKSSGKGPQLFHSDGELVAPDMLVFSHRGIQWVESKHKTVFTWHRISGQWTTGIDLRHYGDYLNVAKQTKMPVWLLFFHRESQPSPDDVKHGCPRECPTGLFGGELFSLVVSENHRSPHFSQERTGCVGHGRSGMVYWAVDQLRLLATKAEVFDAAGSCGMEDAA